VGQVQVANFPDAAANVVRQNSIKLFGEPLVIESQDRNMPFRQMYHRQKNLIADQIVHTRIFENAYFALDFAPVRVNGSPLWRPINNTAFLVMSG
jgi:hypothetical protein